MTEVKVEERRRFEYLMVSLMQVLTIWDTKVSMIYKSTIIFLNITQQLLQPPRVSHTSSLCRNSDAKNLLLSVGGAVMWTIYKKVSQMMTHLFISYMM